MFRLLCVLYLCFARALRTYVTPKQFEILVCGAATLITWHCRIIAINNCVTPRYLCTLFAYALCFAKHQKHTPA